ncbi:hypothetical protein CERSUDRAFT_82422 [Gelatoporia subvermispora B]|uniref:Vacuolar calcium ion transporter n=1 Tax=Ceriporiopsis subvermispora (strain B) TaxID=914234 RepID=M2PP00_CERS8|nr:hypothetical protein CERSUDRAFT_82422 [Gelatoporia subvermispora B]
MPTTTTDRTPLLNGNGGHAASVPDHSRDLFQPDIPSWLASYKWFFFGHWLNILLVFVPLSAIAHYLHWDAALRFSFSFVAIMPLAALLGTATDQLSLKLGQTLSGLLNASFGNAVEIIVGVAALFQGEYRIVQTSLLGSILSNLLLVLGCSFLAGGLKYQEGNFQVTAAQASSSLMTLTCITLVIPAAYHSAALQDTNKGSGLQTAVAKMLALDGQIFDGTDVVDDATRGLRIISRGTAMILLFVYIAYLVFQLKTHAYLYESNAAEEIETPHMSVPAAGSALLLVTVITSFCADYLVASIDETSTRYGIPKAFVGLILLPIVANAAEHVTSVWMALKNKMELTIGICVGSSIQIAAFVVPLLVIIGWITHHDLTLFFADFETIVLFVSVLLVNFLIQDGKSNYMEGLMLIALYLVIALAFWVS